MLRIESDAQEDGRFSRFELISWWDQARLRNARVLVAGAGALGNEIVKNCCLLGVGNLLVADMDRVELSNLSRSVLFRDSDRGRGKAEVACESARAIYGDVRARPFDGNIVHDLGLGAYLWADVIIGGLDNREARLAMNTGARFAGKPWIDGAIELLNGVARVFATGEGPCYECMMSAVDWKILQNRRSCALLTREQMLEGKVPTTPTTAGIIAGFQVQEAVKILHGMEPIAGQGFVFNGLSGESYLVRYTSNPGCSAHEPPPAVLPLGAGVGQVRVGELLDRARRDLGSEAVIDLSRDVISALLCPKCGRREPVFRSLGKVTEREGRCPDCGDPRAPETLLTLAADSGLSDRTFAQVGVPEFDVVTARTEEAMTAYLFDGDADLVVGGLRPMDLSAGLPRPAAPAVEPTRKLQA